MWTGPCLNISLTWNPATLAGGQGETSIEHQCHVANSAKANPKGICSAKAGFLQRHGCSGTGAGTHVCCTHKRVRTMAFKFPQTNSGLFFLRDQTDSHLSRMICCWFRNSGLETRTFLKRAQKELEKIICLVTCPRPQ